MGKKRKPSPKPCSSAELALPPIARLTVKVPQGTVAELSFNGRATSLVWARDALAAKEFEAICQGGLHDQDENMAPRFTSPADPQFFHRLAAHLWGWPNATCSIEFTDRHPVSIGAS